LVKLSKAVFWAQGSFKTANFFAFLGLAVTSLPIVHSWSQ